MQKVKIGYDLDGVIANSSWAWRLFGKLYFNKFGRKLLRQLSIFAPVRFRPFEEPYFSNYIITGRSESDRDVTERWLRLHRIRYDKLIMNHGGLDDIKEFKANALKQHSIAVYIEDDKEIIEYLREVCPDTCIIPIDNLEQ